MKEADRDEAPSGAPPSAIIRRRWVVLALLVGLGAIAALHPETLPPVAGLFAVIVAIIFWPRRSVFAGRGRAPGEVREVAVWPDSGMKAAVEALREPAFIIDRDLMLRYRNPASLIAFGNMALGDPVSLRFRSPQLLSTIERAVGSMQPILTALEERRPVERNWQVEILPIPPYQGERPHFYLIHFRDRTAEVQIERMRTDFIANASHELRTPLASLAGFIATLQGPAKNDPAARDRFLTIMRQQAFRMSRLIDDLLSLSRIEMKRHVLISSTADLVAVFAKVRDQLAPLAAEQEIALLFEAPPQPMPVVGDEDELIQVFSNLVENACKYGGDGKRIVMRIETSQDHGEAVVDASVQDFGPGIPAEHVPRLTERFYRVDIGSSRQKQGTGLGLSIVRNILVRHRARLLVKSKVGSGSIFTARFPSMTVKPAQDAENLAETIL